MTSTGKIRLGALAASCLLPALAFAEEAAAPAVPKLDTGDTAWILVSCAMVLLMTPGLALFYAGMVRKKNVLSTMMQSMFMMGLISLIWVWYGYSLAFSPGHSMGGFIGNFDFLWLNGVSSSTASPLAPTIPHLVYMAFQMMFAIITVALISGSVADRFKFSAWVAFAILWSTLVYNPVAHWVWSPNGFLLAKGALDFAGGTVVHIISGVSALTACLILGPRKGHGKENMLPHNMTYVLLGTGLLWFGWFGFNAGSALGANGIAAVAFVNTNTAAASAALLWSLIEWVRNGKPSALGFASGAVAGLVVITPAAGFVSVQSAAIMGLLVSLVCYGAIFLKEKLGYDDSLDAFGVHGVGGTLGAILTGVFASSAVNPVVTKTGWALVMVQLEAVGWSWLIAVVGTFVLLKLVDAIFGAKVAPREEELGLDLTQHSENGYEI
ncbi:MAG: ammonium transporter [candidate division FCPU426 bacterium]